MTTLIKQTFRTGAFVQFCNAVMVAELSGFRRDPTTNSTQRQVKRQLFAVGDATVHSALGDKIREDFFTNRFGKDFYSEAEPLQASLFFLSSLWPVFCCLLSVLVTFHIQPPITLHLSTLAICPFVSSSFFLPFPPFPPFLQSSFFPSV
jgi:hypothetical protein